jgi:hypothetical protein
MSMLRFMVAGALFAVLPVSAQVPDILVEVDRGRTHRGAAVMQRALLAKPGASMQTALLWFRGKPGIVKIDRSTTRHPHLGPLRQHQRLLFQAGIALVVVDCPSDQLEPTHAWSDGCDDEYRESAQHADDVRSLIAVLRGKHGLSRFFIMGHSKGTMSSRWLAAHLGKEIAGSIHSASINVSTRVVTRGHLAAGAIPRITAPMLHIHHERDGCMATPYTPVARYAQGNLVTVRGGSPAGDPCGGQHFHSYGGREEALVRAVVDWIANGKVTPVAGAPD